MHARCDNLQLKLRGFANSLHDPAQQPIFGASASYNADFPLHSSISSSGEKSRGALRPITSSQRIPDSPVPGRLIVRLASLNFSPLRIAHAATSDLRTIDLFFASLALGPLIPLPRACSILRIATTIAFSS